MDDSLEMTENKVEDFKRRVGFSTAPGLHATDGVRADWRRLPDEMTSEVSGLRLGLQRVYSFKPGLSAAKWSWKRRDKQVSVEVFVSGGGAFEARERLLQIATDTTAMECTMSPGPPSLGDLSIQDISPPFEEVIWAFRNVCVVVNNHSTGREILPVARRIQSFMKSSIVQHIERYVPKVAGIDLSPNPVRVGDTVSLKVRLTNEAAAVALTTEFRPADAADLLDPISHNGLEATFSAREAGRTAFEIHVLDPATLLSPKAGVVINVLPALPR